MSRWLAIVVLLGGGCRDPQIFFTPVTELVTEDRGVALTDDGDLGYVAMRDTTCSFSSQDALILGDINLPGDGEVVLDAAGEHAMARSDAGVHVIGVASELDRFDGAPVSGVLTDRGPVGVDAGCQVGWYAEGRLYAAPADCDPSRIAASRAGDRVWLQAGGRLVSVGADGTVVEHGRADGPMRWDDRAGLLVVADGSELRAIDRGGVEKWTHAFAEPIEDVGSLASAIGVRSGARYTALRRDGSVVARTGDGPIGTMGSSQDGTHVTVTIGGVITIYEATIGSVEPGPSEARAMFD